MLLYKFRSASSFLNLLDILIYQRLYCAKYDTLNDPFEGQFMKVLQATSVTHEPLGSAPSLASSGRSTNNSRIIFQDVGEVANYVPRICSLSAAPDEVRMWSLYAESHQGVAIEIDFSGKLADAREVTYKRALPSHGEGGFPDPNVILTRKTLQWEYEAEYRILLDSDKGVYYDISGCIKRVLLGPRVQKNLREMLIKIVKPSIPLYETELNFADGGVRILGEV